jgi:hypothetical protein
VLLLVLVLVHVLVLVLVLVHVLVLVLVLVHVLVLVLVLVHVLVLAFPLAQEFCIFPRSDILQKRKLPMDLHAIQSALREAGIDGWLFYDFHNRDAIAARILNMDTSRFASRRWFYFIPAEGEPQKLVHRIEPWRCDHLPGAKHVYLPWKQQQDMLRDMLGDAKKVAMQYSPNQQYSLRVHRRCRYGRTGPQLRRRGGVER